MDRKRKPKPELKTPAQILAAMVARTKARPKYRRCPSCLRLHQINQICPLCRCYVPDSNEIYTMCQEIQKTWSPRIREVRGEVQMPSEIMQVLGPMCFLTRTLWKMGPAFETKSAGGGE